MFLKVRMFNASSNKLNGATGGDFLIQINSINSTISEVKNVLSTHLALKTPMDEEEINKSIRIFFNGKELDSRFTVFEYEIKLNNVIQVLVNDEHICRREKIVEPVRRGSTSSIDCDSERGVDETTTKSSDDDENVISHPPLTDSTDEAPNNWIECDQCLDNDSINCKICSCCVCGGKNDPEKQIICDECNSVYHLWCHEKSPLDRLPPEEEDWYCFQCVNNDKSLIKEKELAYLKKMSATTRGTKRSGQSASDKVSRKKVKQSSSELRSKRSTWGHGMACVGRRYSDLSYSFGSDYYGPIPGVEVGTTWRFRFQVSEAGVHTPLVAGIAGKEAIGASSIVFSGTYCDDTDLGDDIYYTGSGGHGVTEFTGARSSGNRPQVADQTLKRANKALAMSCAAPFNETLGAAASHNWKDGKPIRVLRSGNSKCTKVKSPFCPPRGIRYDGIYHVVKYWPEKSTKTGMIVWRFHLRRNDPVPAPWTKDGKNRIRRLALEAIIEPASDPLARPPVTGQRSSRENEIGGLSSKLMALIQQDTVNAKIWQNLMCEYSSDSGLTLIRSIGESFKCACCMDIAVNQPVTSKCGHIFCRNCLKKSLEQEQGTCCPVCRHSLSRKLPGINRPLEQILRSLYPFVLTMKK